MAKVVKIKALKYQSHFWSFGVDYEVQVGMASARKLAPGQDLPKMGYDLELVSKEEEGFRKVLMLSNISGTFYLRSSSVPVANWREEFSVEVSRE